MQQKKSEKQEEDFLEQHEKALIKKRMAEAPGIIQSILVELDCADWAVDGLMVIFELLANRLEPQEAVEFAADLQRAVFTHGQVFDRAIESYSEMVLGDYNAKGGVENELQN